MAGVNEESNQDIDEKCKPETTLTNVDDLQLYQSVFNMFSSPYAPYQQNNIIGELLEPDLSGTPFQFQTSINTDHVYNNNYGEECTANTSSIKDGCNPTKRIIAALKHYQCLDVINNENDKAELVKHCHQKYKSLLDDYIHILVEHNNQKDLDEIRDSLAMDCNIQKCLFSVRHFRNRNNDKYIEENEEVTFYRDIMDAMHCYLMHLYDCGLRVKMDKIEQKQADCGQFCDNKFSSVCEQIKKQQQKSKHIVNCNEQNKFDVMPQNENYKDFAFMDGFYAFMTRQINTPKMQQINTLLTQHEYDSDVVHLDINCNDCNDDGTNSNIGQHLANKIQYDSIKKYMLDIKLHKHTFIIGHRFYYWQYYKYQREESDGDNSDDSWDELDAKRNELFVEAKYASIKEEILTNTICPLKQHKYRISIHKANKYIQTKQRNETICYVDYLHYDIDSGTVLSLEHILSVILYCDWTDLCSAFSATFRQKNPYESQLAIKQRNRQFAQWSKLLRETVECFGFTFGDMITGPFFCGMSFVIVMQEFHIRLCGPTSTSRQIAVAHRFGGDKGIIMQLNNDNFDDTDLPLFGCSWLSNYPGEDEWLFVGGLGKLRIENVFIVQMRQNFEPFFKCLFDFDCMLDGSQPHMLYEPELCDDDHLILDELIRHKLKINGFENSYIKYINNTFDAFINHKTQIVLNLHFINEYFSGISGLILNPLLCIDSAEKRKEKLPIIPLNLGATNVFKAITLDLFQNVKDILIHTTSTSAFELLIYPFDLLSLLHNIHSSPLWTTNDLKITITAHCYDEVRRSWIFDVFSTSIAAELQNKNLTAHLVETTDDTGSKQDSLIITKQ